MRFCFVEGSEKLLFHMMKEDAASGKWPVKVNVQMRCRLQLVNKSKPQFLNRELTQATDAQSLLCTLCICVQDVWASPEKVKKCRPSLFI